jgi:hypothetical protein
MALSNWGEADSIKAKQIWAEYQQQHDLSGRMGQIAGIDPASGRIWFGESIQDIVSQRDAEGLDSLRSAAHFSQNLACGGFSNPQPRQPCVRGDAHSKQKCISSEFSKPQLGQRILPPSES